MSRPHVSVRAAAALFLERQQLDRPRGRRLTAANLADLVDHMKVTERLVAVRLRTAHPAEKAHINRRAADLSIAA